MAASGPSGKRSKNAGRTAKPNLMPIMNLFLVIIPMLITMITATGLQMMALNIPVEPSGTGNGGDNKNEDEVKKTDIYLAILPDKFEIRVDDEIFTEIPILSKEGKREFDFLALNKVIDELDKKYPEVEKIKVAPSDNIAFDSFIKTMDVCKMYNRFPNIGYGTVKKTLVRK